MPGLPKWFSRFAKKIPTSDGTPVDKLPESQGDVASPAAQTIKDAGLSVHALIIGIDAYENQTELKGAVADADAFTEYLTKDIGVPQKNIIPLRNKQATRQGIVDAMIGLSTNNDIVKDTPIIIYYSGHGGEIDAPADRLEYGPKIQCLLPQDVGKSENGVEVVKGAAPIPDFTIGALLENIAYNKGNNITVIFDCCHSAGGSRDEEKDAARVVDKTDIPPVSADLDNDTIRNLSRSGQGSTAEGGFIGQAMKSHVLIAACGHAEVAFENGSISPRRGYFTLALLERLRQVNIDSLTYEGLMKRIGRIPARNPQNPVCEGENINRILFNGVLPASNNTLLSVIRDPPEADATDNTTTTIDPNAPIKYYLQAGAAQGISPGSTYSIHDSDKLESKDPLGELAVQDVQPFRSLLSTPSFDMPKYPCARQLTYGKQEALGVYCTPEFVESMAEDQKWNDMFVSAGDGFVLHPVEEPLAHVVVGVIDVKGEKHATFRIKEQTAIKYGIDPLPHTIPLKADRIVPALRAIARWSWHLRRNPVRRPLESKVKLEFLQLTSRGRNDQGVSILTPTGPDLNVDGVADVVVDAIGTNYGLRITNNCGRDLYAYTVYFSIRDQSTALRYTKVAPNATGVVDPSLPKADPSLPPENQGNVLTIGYGSGGTEAIRHFLKPTTETDVGIYKVFLSTEHADFGSLELPSPFDDNSKDMDSGKDGKSLPDLPFWDTMYLTVVQRHDLPQGLQQARDRTENNPLLKIESKQPSVVACRDDDGATVELFMTPNLTDDVISKATAMRLRTLSHQTLEEGADEEGRAQFHISLYKQGRSRSRVESHDDQPGNTSIAIDGQVIGREHQIWKEAQAGDRFRVTVKVTGVGWISHVDEAALRIW